MTRKAFVITLIFAMIFSAAIGAGAYAVAMSIFGGTTIDKVIEGTDRNASALFFHDAPPPPIE